MLPQPWELDCISHVCSLYIAIVFRVTWAYRSACAYIIYGKGLNSLHYSLPGKVTSKFGWPGFKTFGKVLFLLGTAADSVSVQYIHWSIGQFQKNHFKRTWEITQLMQH